MKIVIVTSRFPYPLEKGDKLRLFNIATGLAQNHEVWIFSLSLYSLDPQHLEIFKSNRIKLTNHVLPKWKRVLNIVKTSRKNLPLQVAYFYDKNIQESMKWDILAIKPDVIFTHLVRCARYTRQLDFPNVIDYMDAFSASYHRISEHQTGFIKKLYNRESVLLKSYEARVAKDFVQKIVISEQDKDLLKDHVKNLSVISNGVNLEFFKPRIVGQKFELLFVGNLGYQPNVIAIKYLAREIVPKLPRSLKLLVAGARPSHEVKHLASSNIVILPWVEDIRDAYNQAKIFIAPIFSGAGQQNKILESMAMGVPCITTTMVANGIGANNTHLMIADNPEEYVQAIRILMDDKFFYESMRNAALDFVKHNFSWKTKVAELEVLMSKLVANTVDEL